MSQFTTAAGRCCWCVVLLLYSGSAVADSFALCQRTAAEQPDSYDAALCFYRTATNDGNWTGASQALNKAMQRYPQIPWYRLVYGYVLASKGDTRATIEFETAAGAFAQSGELQGELLARANLRIRYFENGNLDKANSEYSRIRDIGELTEDAEFRVRALVVQGRHLIDTKSDLNAANGALTKAETLAHDNLPYFLRREILNELGQLNTTFGNYPKAIDYFRAFRLLADKNNDLTGIALAQTNIANTMLELHQVSPAEVLFQNLITAAELASKNAAAAQALSLELFSSRVLAEVHAASSPAMALRLTGNCIDRAEDAELFWQKSQCLWVQAFALAQSDPDRATKTIDQAVKTMLIAANEDHAQMSFAWRYLMRIHWQTQHRAQSINSALRALDAMEALRAAQPTGHSRSSVFSAWTQDYRWLIGRLLADAGSMESDSERRERIALAVSVGERMRARNLLESLASAEKTNATETNADIAAQISQINLQLFNATPDNAKLLQLQLNELERQEATQRGVATLPIADFRLGELQAALKSNEVALIMHIAREKSDLDLEDGDSWIVSIERNSVRLYSLPSASYLLRAATALRSPNKTISEQFAYGLYQRLFAPAMAELSTGIEHLIIVPDAPLQAFPFAALSASATYAPITIDRKLSITPSLATWLRFRNRTRSQLPPRSLVVAEPDLTSYGEESSDLQVWQGAQSVSLTALPAARSEAKAILNLLPRSTIWLSTQSSEAALKRVDRSEFGILHFAAHALVDDENAEHSALLLSPGNEIEDGLFQVREISRTPLNGQLVVLASCQSALGRDIRGEGVISLTRAFLAAGAGAVIGTLWPVRDDWSAELMQRFYTHLSDGLTAADALSRAQTLMHLAGYPTEAWSAFVVHGDGNWQIDPSTSTSSTIQWAAAAALLLAVFFGFFWQTRRNFRKTDV